MLYGIRTTSERDLAALYHLVLTMVVTHIAIRSPFANRPAEWQSILQNDGSDMAILTIDGGRAVDAPGPVGGDGVLAVAVLGPPVQDHRRALRGEPVLKKHISISKIINIKKGREPLDCKSVFLTRICHAYRIMNSSGTLSKVPVKNNKTYKRNKLYRPSRTKPYAAPLRFLKLKNSSLLPITIF